MQCRCIPIYFHPLLSPNLSESDPLLACCNIVLRYLCYRKSGHMGWRYLMYTLGGITLFIFFL
ncbi:hypothetical protein CC78DRAFT_350444 [Lojkania enalia]|uniref:Uncharacterized protein n=1 Tax=Lojkania enalia TaxID=147567 RepID=A0A9P4KJK1_9PLEO|nr:hypothetical protein CC78DRAFT_350444 [Didymosphaeria enalia]